MIVTHFYKNKYTKMKKAFTLCLTIFLCLSIQNIHAQQIELLGGANSNVYLTPSEEFGSYIFSNTRMGYSTGAILELYLNPKESRYPVSLEFLFNNYRNEFGEDGGGLGGASVERFNINITSVELGFYPLRFNLSKHFRLNIGMRTSFLLKEKHTGLKTYSTSSSGTTEIDISDEITRNKINSGLSFRLSLNEIEIGNKVYFKPYYSLYLGLENEFKEYSGIFSIQNGLGIAVGLNAKE